VDYTGGNFYQGELKILKNINDVVDIIHVQRFDQSNLQYINLPSNQQYKFVVTGNGSVRDLGPVYLDSIQTTRYVIVSRPNLNPFASRWDTLTIDLDGDYTTKTITCSVNTTVSTTTYLDVYYANQTPYILFSAITPEAGTSVVLTQSITDENLTYYASCYTDDTTYGVRTVNKLIKLYNTTQYYDGLGDLDFGDTILGESKIDFLNWVSVVVIVIVAGLFSEVSMGTGAIAVGLATSFMWYIGLFVIPEIIVLSILTIGVMMKLSEKRFGVIT
jgi:hypothetical protein